MKLTTHLSNYLNDSFSVKEAYYALAETIKSEGNDLKDGLANNHTVVGYGFEWAGLTIYIDAEFYFTYELEDGAFRNELRHTEVDLSEIYITVNEDDSEIEIDLPTLKGYLK